MYGNSILHIFNYLHHPSPQISLISIHVDMYDKNNSSLLGEIKTAAYVAARPDHTL